MAAISVAVAACVLLRSAPATWLGVNGSGSEKRRVAIVAASSWNSSDSTCAICVALLPRSRIARTRTAGLLAIQNFTGTAPCPVRYGVDPISIPATSTESRTTVRRSRASGFQTVRCSAVLASRRTRPGPCDRDVNVARARPQPPDGVGLHTFTVSNSTSERSTVAGRIGGRVIGGAKINAPSSAVGSSGRANSDDPITEADGSVGSI